MKRVEIKNGGYFLKMEKGDKSPLKPGRKAGGKNRSTIAKIILETKAFKLFDKKTMEKIREQIPNADDMNIEQLMTAKLSMRAIERADTNAYIALMNNAYKPHAQQTEDITQQQPTIHIVKTYNDTQTVDVEISNKADSNQLSVE